MSAQDILKKLPSGGFLKTTRGASARISKEQRVALIRRGNELFNKGDFDLAQKIFVTTKYSDGLIRIGDRLADGGKPLEALRAYWLAPCPEKAAVLIERIAKVMKQWLAEGKKAGTT
ncbi:MAG: hypothetical protein ACLQCB_04445 [Spirochaetia bacterium]